MRGAGRGAFPFRAGCEYAVRDGCGIDLVETGDDQIGLGRLQQRLIAKPRNADGSHAPGARGGNAGRRVFQHHALRGWDVQRLRCQEEQCRIGLATRYVCATQVRIEDRQQQAPVGQAQAAQHGPRAAPP